MPTTRPWWAGWTVFLTVLPNAPYLLTDIVHLISTMCAGLSMRLLFYWCMKTLLVSGTLQGSPFASLMKLCTPTLYAVEIQVDDWCRVQREHLAEHQVPNDGNAQRPAQLRAGARAKGQWQAAQQRRHRRHRNRAKTQ